MSRGVLDLDDILDDAIATPTPEQPALSQEQPPTRRRRGKCPGNVLFFDLETIPDYSRESLFSLPEIPEPGPRTPAKDMLPADQFRTASLEEIKQIIRSKRPDDEYLRQLDAVEMADKKPRKGLFELIDELRGESQAIEAAKGERRKTMSCTPEFCRIVSFAWAWGDDPAEASTFGDKGGTKDHDTYERCVLKKFWELASRSKVIVGFNHVGFDLPVIYARSMLLGVDPSRQIDLKPWGGDVVDVMAARWPRGGAKKMKDYARICGIPVEAGDMDGSKVEETLKADPAKVAAYNRSDVMCLREMYLMGRGLFWS